MTVTWRKGVTVLSIPLLMPLFACCQLPVNKYELGFGLGFFVYQGDLAKSDAGSFRTQRPGLSLMLNRLLTNSFSLRSNLAIGGLKGDDGIYSSPAYRQQRNFRFTSPVAEISESIVWNPLATNKDSKSTYPYFMAGIGYSFLHIRRNSSDFNSEYFADSPEVLQGLADDQQHKLPRGIPVIPLGIGIRHSVSSKLSVNVEASYRLTFTDYLDGFSQAANPGKNDHYSTYGVGLTYKLGNTNRLSCPVVRN